MQHLKALESEMRKAPDKQLSLTDPDDRSMRTCGGGRFLGATCLPAFQSPGSRKKWRQLASASSDLEAVRGEGEFEVIPRPEELRQAGELE